MIKIKDISAVHFLCAHFGVPCYAQIKECLFLKCPLVFKCMAIIYFMAILSLGCFCCFVSPAPLHPIIKYPLNPCHVQGHCLCPRETSILKTTEIPSLQEPTFNCHVKYEVIFSWKNFENSSSVTPFMPLAVVSTLFSLHPEQCGYWKQMWPLETHSLWNWILKCNQ